MQKVMSFEKCHDCGQDIKPGEPFSQTVKVDLHDSGRVFSIKPRTQHLECPGEKQQEKTP